MSTLTLVPANEDDYLDIDQLLDDQKTTTVTIWNRDKTKSMPLSVTYRPGAVTSRMLRLMRTAEGKSDIDETICEFMAKLLVRWSIKDKKTGGELGVTYADIEDTRLELLMPVLSHIVKDISDTQGADTDTDGDAKKG